MSHPFGRQAIGVNQPPGGGREYPFVAPSSDIRDLLGDFYLSYEDDDCEFTLPFRVAWLYGFGTESADLPDGMPAPTHTRDLVVVDADDRVVFDSTVADSYEELAWGGRLLIIEWTTDDEVCRCTTHTAWSPEQTPQLYDEHISPESGELDGRTYQRLPGRVKAIRVGLDVMRADVVFEAGYNITLAGSTTTRQDGGLFVDRIDMDAVPGAGTGRQPACADTEQLVRRVNNIEPDAAGNFIIQLDNCYRGERAIFSSDGEDGRTAFFGFEDMTEEEAMSTLRLFNDCRPCCSCDYYLRTYRGLKRVWNNWKEVGEAAEEVRDSHQINVDRWETERDCRVEHAAHLRVKAEGSCKLAVSGQFCNFSDACLGPVELRFTIQLYRFNPRTNLIEEVAFGYMSVTDAKLNASSTDGEESYVPLVRGQVISAFADFMEPRSNASFKARICLPCRPGDSFKVTMTVHAPDPAAEGDEPAPLPPPEVELPSELTDFWEGNGIPPGDTPRALDIKGGPLDAFQAPRQCATECTPYSNELTY